MSICYDAQTIERQTPDFGFAAKNGLAALASLAGGGGNNEKPTELERLWGEYQAIEKTMWEACDKYSELGRLAQEYYPDFKLKDSSPENWERAIEAINDEFGVTDAYEAVREAENANLDASNRIHDAPIKDLEDVLIKLKFWKAMQPAGRLDPNYIEYDFEVILRLIDQIESLKS